MDDKVRVKDAEVGLVSVLILITFLWPIWKHKMIYNTSKLWEAFTKIEVWFQNAIIPSFLEIIPFV